jgi:chaperonin GroEL
VAYVRAIDALEGLTGDNEDQNTGIAIVRRALEEPLRQIVANAGVEGSVVVQEVKKGKADFGFNAQTEKYEHFYKTGVIDPTKVARIALENAASVAGMILTTETLIAEIPEEKEPIGGGAPGMGGMGGMM